MTEAESTPDKKTIPFFPDHIATEAKVTLGILGLAIVVGVVGTLWPVGLEAPADPMTTPAHAKPEWYFLFLYEMLKYIPKTAGVLIPIGALIMMTIWPFLDRKEDTQRAVRTRAIFSAIALIVVIGLTILGMSS
jgi:quinol-cytochrome oxidoreductase complex cytochrome b subunit